MGIKVGVPYETFWHLNPSKMMPFIKAYGQRQQERSDEMWLMGQYVAAALDATVCNAMPFVKRRRKGKYPEKPIRVTPLTPEEKKEEEEKALNQFLDFFSSMESENKGK